MKIIKRIAAGFLVVLSLCVSSVAVCICSHHTENIEIGAGMPACHEHAETRPETGADALHFEPADECCCIQPAPRVFSKSETLTIEKQAAALPSASVAAKTVSTPVAAEKAYFEKPFHLSDAFDNFKSPRAPPAL